MRNPFRIRASQRAVSDEQFVRLFAAGGMEVLEDAEDPWSGLIFLRSAPGGGKTSFLRLLTPGPLKIATKLADDPFNRATYDVLLKSEALGLGGPDLLGVMVTFPNEYRDVDDLEVVNGTFRALLNARVVLATLRATLERFDRSYPEDLDLISVQWSPTSGASIPKVASGEELFRWASGIEETVYEALDQLGERGIKSTAGHGDFESLYWFSQAKIFCDSRAVKCKRILLFDDLHLLDESQRKSIREFLTDSRLSCGIWVAERLEALEDPQLLSEGALEGRDYGRVIHLEERWSRKSQPFGRFLVQIAELRSRGADGFENRDFFTALSDTLDPGRWDQRFGEAVGEIEERVLQALGNSGRYNEWISDARKENENNKARALAWRKLEIYIARDMGRRQRTLEFGSLTEEELRAREDSSVSAAAELFLSKECGAPMYFGKQKLTQLSSWNVDQFVELSGDLFEEMAVISSGRRGETRALTAERQHAILKQVASRRWEGIPRRLSRGYGARMVLEAVGEFCRGQTYRVTAPYAPGVTGIAITMREREEIISMSDASIALYGELREILASLVANNLLEPKLDRKNKGDRFLILYLNRLLCAQFDLPLGYGGWRHKSPKELVEWVSKGSAAVKERKLV